MPEQSGTETAEAAQEERQRAYGDVQWSTQDQRECAEEDSSEEGEQSADASPDG